MLKALSRFDTGIARGEAALATLVLISMIVAASCQAIFRNLAGMEVGWANGLLENLTWVDPFLQKGTLWLAFLGASLATREGRHIGIDLFPRLAPKRVKLLMRGVAAAGSAMISFFLCRAFWSAVLVNAEERLASYEVYGDQGSLHVCDATAQQVANASLENPTMFCAIRTALAGLGVPVETPEAALQLIVPVMFFVMAVRLAGNSAGAFYELSRNESDAEEGDKAPSGEPDGKTAGEPDALKDEEE